MRGQGAAGADVGVLEVVDGRADHDRAGTEEVEDGAGGLGGVVDAVADPAEQHDEAVALAGAERVHARGPRRAAYVVEQVGLVPFLRHGAQHDGDRAAVAPAQRARARQHRLVGLGAEHGVDDERLEAGVPGAADLGGAGVHLGGGEGDLAAVAQHAGMDVAGVVGVQDGVQVGLDDLDAEPHQVHGLLEADHAGQGPRGGAEDLGGHGGAVELRVPGLVGVPVDEALDARLDDHADPGPVLGAELGEPRHLVVHAGHRGRAELAGRPVQVVDGASAGLGARCGARDAGSARRVRARIEGIGG